MARIADQKIIRDIVDQSSNGLFKKKPILKHDFFKLKLETPKCEDF